MSKDFDGVSAAYAGGIDDPWPIYRDCRANNPVMKGDIVSRFGATSFGSSVGRETYTLFKHADIMAVLRDPVGYQSGILMTNGLGAFLGDFMLTGMDGDRHRVVRGLLQPCFSVATVKAWRESVTVPLIRDEMVKGLVPRGRAELISDLALMFPIRVIYAILGFPNDPQAVSQFAGWALRILAGPAAGEAARAAAFNASQELYDHIKVIVAARRAAGTQGDDLMSRLIHTEFEGRALDDNEITNFVRMLLPAAAETTTRTFATLMTLLLERPQMWEQLRADRSLIPKAIDEAVRFEPVATYKVREVMADVEFRGVKIPKGSVVSCCAASGNRDEEVFEDSETFDINRKSRASFGFGFGTHACIGLLVAKSEIDVAVNAILDLMPDIRFDPDKPRPKFKGIQLRGPDAVHVVWTPS